MQNGNCRCINSEAAAVAQSEAAAITAVRLLCLFMVIGTAAFTYHGYSSIGSLSSNAGSNAMMASVLKRRKLRENMVPPTPDNREDHFNLEDYRPIDPVPSSKASIRPGPIQHGTPLMPYIPNPSPSPGKPPHG